ncbi:MAG: transglutaminase-like domain-containing protein [Clostridiales Family XIII bacterium]|nr:transglutaminase-like domain-containing protein [Clostridiales Family XIII bacterium]
MKKKNEPNRAANGFSLLFAAEGARAGRRAADPAGRFLLAFLLFAGFAAAIGSGLGLEAFGAAALAQWLIGAALCLLLCVVTRRRIAVLIALLAALAVLAVASRQAVGEGWCVVFNRIFEGFEYRFGRIFPFYDAELPPESVRSRAALFLLFPTALLAALTSLAVCAGALWRHLLLLFAAAVFAGAVVLGLPVWGPALVLLAFALAGLRARSVTRGNRAPDLGKAMLPLLLALAVGLSALAAPLLPIGGALAYDASAARRSAEDLLRAARYGGSASAMPEGDFSGLGDFAPAETPALSVAMNAPRAAYLKGYVGEVYTGNGWTALAPETRGKYAELFSWLHGEDFYGQGQYAALVSALAQDAKQGEDIRTEVRNAGASRAYIYAPYGLGGLSGAVLDKNGIGDENVGAEGIAGQRAYGCTASSYRIEDYNELFALLYEAKNAKAPAAVSYLERENAYREFVYGVYLDVPDAAEAAIEGLLAPLGIAAGEDVSFNNVRNIVLYVLLSNNAYSETPEQAPPGEDFAARFLAEGKDGYSVHFASAAALLFRYLGVPARYAEGYFITDEDAAAMRPGEPFAVNETRAHAWVEIYRDGVGFVPFEVTPPYAAPIEGASAARSGGSGSSGSSAEPEPERREDALRFLLLILLLALLLALALAVFLTVRRLSARRRRGRLFADADNAAAVRFMVAYTVKLLAHMGADRQNGSLCRLVPDVERLMGPPFAARYAGVVETQREAAFGEKTISDERRADVRAFTDETLKALKESQGFVRKLRLKWILCVY